jgi:hypothetical protein
MIALILAFTLMNGTDIYEPVKMPDGRVLKCVTTPTGTFCY